MVPRSYTFRAVASQQLPLFDANSGTRQTPETIAARPTVLALALSARDGRPLSKRERALNRLIAKVQALRTRFEDEKRRLDDWLVLHAAHIPSRVERVTTLRKEILRTFAAFLDDRRLNRSDRTMLSRILSNQLDEILVHDELPDPDVQALFERLNGVTWANAVQQGIDAARTQMTEMFADLGLEIEVPDLRPGMSSDDVSAEAAKVAAELHRLSQAQEPASRPERRHTKRQAKAEERLRKTEQARKISVGAVYKRLVKTLHPDLEPDRVLRDRKSALMQEVTVAYAQHDMHTLLRLELEWIGTAPTDAARLSDETMSAYVDALEQQVRELQMECDTLMFHPRYAPIIVEDDLGFPALMNVPAEVQRLDLIIETLSGACERIAEGLGWQELRGMIREAREAERREVPLTDLRPYANRTPSRRKRQRRSRRSQRR